jgi:hypothetical protein
MIGDNDTGEVGWPQIAESIKCTVTVTAVGARLAVAMARRESGGVATVVGESAIA